MNLLIATKLIGKFVLPGFASTAILISQGLHPLAEKSTSSSDSSVTTISASFPSPGLLPASVNFSPSDVEPSLVQTVSGITTASDLIQSPAYPFGNPAGCASIAPPDHLSANEMVVNVQSAIGNEYDLAERRQTYIWNGEMGTMLDVTNNPYVFEFAFNEFQHPLTYRGDKIATIFMVNGFIVWFRAYGNNFRLRECFLSSRVRLANDQIQPNLLD